MSQQALTYTFFPDYFFFSDLLYRTDISKRPPRSSFPATSPNNRESAPFDFVKVSCRVPECTAEMPPFITPSSLIPAVENFQASL